MNNKFTEGVGAFAIDQEFFISNTHASPLLNILCIPRLPYSLINKIEISLSVRGKLVKLLPSMNKKKKRITFLPFNIPRD